jgi:hypothetical protein
LRVHRYPRYVSHGPVMINHLRLSMLSKKRDGRIFSLANVGYGLSG